MASELEVHKYIFQLHQPLCTHCHTPFPSDWVWENEDASQPTPGKKRMSLIKILMRLFPWTDPVLNEVVQAHTQNSVKGGSVFLLVTHTSQAFKQKKDISCTVLWTGKSWLVPLVLYGWSSVHPGLFFFQISKTAYSLQEYTYYVLNYYYVATNPATSQIKSWKCPRQLG